MLCHLKKQNTHTKKNTTCSFPLLRMEGMLTLCNPDFLQLTEVLEKFCSRHTKLSLNTKFCWNATDENIIIKENLHDIENAMLLHKRKD